MQPTSALLRRALMDQEDAIAQAGAMTPGMAQMSATQDRWKRFPGSRPGGTGATGLQSNDSRGWAAMQNDNIDSMQMMSDEPLQVRGNYGGTDFARQNFSIGGGLDAHQEQRARLLEALLLNQGDPNSLNSVGHLRSQKGRW